MTLTEKYIQKAMLRFDNVSTSRKNGGISYHFNCDRCSPFFKEGYKKRKRVAALLPRKESKYVYQFSCPRCKKLGLEPYSQPFKDFLFSLDPELGNSYQKEKNHHNNNPEKIYKERFL